MARLSDIIEAFIKELIDDTDGIVQIQRNALASRFNCVPSQINYVIDTRFTADRGYYVESRRGGGGCVTIRRINTGASDYITHIMFSMGDSLSQQAAEAFINNFIDYKAITVRESLMLKAAVSDRTMGWLSQPARDRYRAVLLRNMLAAMLQ